MPILVIEDEPRILAFVRRGLEAQGFVVDAAGDGATGLRRVSDRHYDLIVLDLLLPGLDGLAVLRELSRREPALPVLILSARADLRTTIVQAEALFTVLRSKKRPVRLMRVPGESHELTRSGTPFRRAENLVQVRDWFRHFLVEGKRGLPPLPKVRAGR